MTSHTLHLRKLATATRGPVGRAFTALALSASVVLIGLSAGNALATDHAATPPLKPGPPPAYAARSGHCQPATPNAAA